VDITQQLGGMSRLFSQDETARLRLSVIKRRIAAPDWLSGTAWLRVTCQSYPLIEASLVDGVDDVAASLFDFFELEKIPLLGFAQ
jgi:hypothetical protein